MRTIAYDTLLGPAVRIGVLQNVERVRLALRGDYRVVSGGREIARAAAGQEFTIDLGAATPGRVQYRLVLRKCRNAADAAATTSPEPALEPLETIRLGYEFGPDASAVEHWRCSRPFASREEAEAARAKLPHPERVSVLPERATPASGSFSVTSGTETKRVDTLVRFEPIDPESARVLVHDVIVGLEYHWRHNERQRFRGVIEICIDNAGLLTVVSEVPAEAYLFSVNSSEMMSVMPEELLKAQTVAARNTLFATMGKHHYADAFDLCADDHCQCYRGSSRETADSRRVTLATAGEIMISDGEICDARYSKMCGGFMEAFESVWNEDPRAYLPAGVDAAPGTRAHKLYPADTEKRAKALIESKPDCWCNTTIEDVPPYLKYSAPYFRWSFRYTREEAEALISRTIGKNMGELRRLVPLKRGASGRIEFLRIETSAGEWVIGKELQIRKALSPTCLYSTAFLVDHEIAPDGRLEAITLSGGGWGHGAGLCQIGATMMAYRGVGYRDILSHYYPKTKLASLGAPASADELDRVIALGESRVGERCFEYYNCYAVATCPVYLEHIALEAQEPRAGQPGVFAQSGDAIAVDLEKRGIACQFLTFTGPKATAKS